MRLPLRPILISAVALVVGCSGGSPSPADPRPVPSQPGSLPLLDPGPLMGVIYSQPEPGAEPALDAAFAASQSAGALGYELSIAWHALESSPGVVDLSFAQLLLDTLEASGMTPYLVLTTIDTVQLSVPPDLQDPGDSTELAPGLAWDDPAMLGRFEMLLDGLVPLLVAKGGFYLSVGNEVDAWLGARLGQVSSYSNFVDHARSYAQAIEPGLAIGVTATFDVVANQPLLLDQLQSVSDRVAFTYYPLNGDFSVRPPAEVAADLALLRAANGPGPMLLQEVGYPAGLTSGPTNGSSEAAQRAFVENVFAYLQTDPDLRFVSFLHLADWTAADLDLFETYYGISDPAFREFLGTLGMHQQDGTARLAWAAYLAGLNDL